MFSLPAPLSRADGSIHSVSDAPAHTEQPRHTAGLEPHPTDTQGPTAPAPQGRWCFRGQNVPAAAGEPAGHALPCSPRTQVFQTTPALPPEGGGPCGRGPAEGLQGPLPVTTPRHHCAHTQPGCRCFWTRRHWVREQRDGCLDSGLWARWLSFLLPGGRARASRPQRLRAGGLWPCRPAVAALLRALWPHPGSCGGPVSYPCTVQSALMAA